MKNIVAISTAVVALGFVSGRSHRASNTFHVPSRIVSSLRRTPPETRSFAYGSAQDGDGGETITRDGDMISGDMAMGAKHVHYEGRVAADGTIPRLELRAWRSAVEAKHPRVLSAIVGRDSAQLIEHLGSRVDTLRFASQPGMLSLAAANDNPSVGLIELLIARARLQKARSARVPILLIDPVTRDAPAKDKVAAGVLAIDVTFLAADTVMLGTPTSKDQMRVIIGADGRCRGVSNGATAKTKLSLRPTSKRVPSSK